jgi:tetratricopeptide (TPR) repeat protein
MARLMGIPPLIALLISAQLYAGEAAMRRNAERQARAAAIKNLDAANKKSMGPYITALNGIGQWLVAQKASTDAANILVEIQTVDENAPVLAALKRSIDEIKDTTALDEAKRKELAQKLAAARKARANGKFDLASTCFRAGLTARALQHVNEAIEVDPDHAAARQALGHVKTPEGWQTSFAASQIQKGNTYVPEYGWVPKAAAEKTKGGEWFENGKWMALSDADVMHSSAALPWVIETAHFTIKSTAPRKVSIKLAERVESFWQVCYLQYIDFFMRGVDRRTGQMNFNPPLAKKMQITYYGDKKDYETFVKKELKGPLSAFLTMLPGFWYGVNQTLYYSGVDDNPIFVFFLQHELAQQIASTYAQSGAGQIREWVKKCVSHGVLYTKPGEDGQLTLSFGKFHNDVIECGNMMGSGTLPPISILMNMESEQFNAPPNNENNNKASGAFCVFMLDWKDGLYAPDFLEFLYDSYRGSRPNLSDYIGMDAQAIEKEFLNYIAAAR